MGQVFLPLLEAPLDLTFGIVLEGQDFSWISGTSWNYALIAPVFIRSNEELINVGPHNHIFSEIARTWKCPLTNCEGSKTGPGSSNIWMSGGRHPFILQILFNPFQPKFILVHTTVTGTCRHAYKTCKNWPLCSYVGWHQHSQQKSQRSVLRWLLEPMGKRHAYYEQMKSMMPYGISGGWKGLIVALIKSLAMSSNVVKCLAWSCNPPQLEEQICDEKCSQSKKLVF